MDNQKANETHEFLWRRLSEDVPLWAIGVPILFALFVVALIVIFRPERKLLAAILGAVIVGVVGLVYLPLAFIFRPIFSWLVILVPVMGVALFYVGMMYINDARSVHPVWAIFLGLLRCSVYVMLAIVFMLPGCQYSDKQEYPSKTIFLFDTSGSMFTIDDVPIEGQKLETMPTRQDKIWKLLTSKTDENDREQMPFIDRVLQRSPLTVYRFGPVIDDVDVLSLTSKKKLTDEEWKRWLNPDPKDVAKPNLEQLKTDDERKEKQAAYNARLDMIELLRSGTNIGGSALAMHKLENNSFVQAIVIISDGQSNLGSEEARTNFLARVNNPKRQILVITIGVGQFRQPASIRIEEIQVAEETRPDDRFPLRVPVVGQGLAGEPFTVRVEVKRVKDVTGKAVDEKAFILPEKAGVFKGQGDNPQDLVEFEIDVQKLKGIVAKEDKDSELEGEWQFRAFVPRNAKEAFTDPEHVTKPIKVQVQKRALRVLLFASGATREFQFLRTIIFRETIEKRMEMSVCVQTGREDHVDHNVPPERMLADFPDKIGPNDPGKQYQSLSDYDVVVCFDPDWSRLSAKQLNTMRDWVSTQAGGVVFVAGPVFSYQLARAGGRDISSLLAIFPVVLQDNRLHGLGFAAGGLGHDSTRAYALNFSPAAKQFDFLKLDESGESPTAGWNGYFWGDEKFVPDPGKDLRPRKGFFYYYPVERLKPASLVAATFAGPKESRIGDKSDAFRDQQPFIVAMPFGQGKSLYLGSGEFWRMRAYKDGFHERFWIKTIRYVGAGAVQQKKYGRLLMPRSMPVGEVRVEAQVKGADLFPLARDARPFIIVKRIDKGADEPANPKEKEPKEQEAKEKEREEKVNKPTSFDLKAKELDGVWKGDFEGKFRITEPGEYEFQLPIPNTNESLKQTLTVRKLRPELDNVRTNFGYLHQMASEAEPFLKKLPPEVRKEIEPLLTIPQDQAQGGGGTTKRLFFPLSAADAVSKCLVPVQPKTDSVMGRLEDLWDMGSADVYWWTLGTPLIIGVLGALILLIMDQWRAALIFFGICVLMTFLMAASHWIIVRVMGKDLPITFSYLMMLIVSFLGIEWLARKLLRLA